MDSLLGQYLDLNSHSIIGIKPHTNLRLKSLAPQLENLEISSNAPHDVNILSFLADFPVSLKKLNIQAHSLLKIDSNNLLKALTKLEDLSLSHVTLVGPSETLPLKRLSIYGGVQEDNISRFEKMRMIQFFPTSLIELNLNYYFASNPGDLSAVRLENFSKLEKLTLMKVQNLNALPISLKELTLSCSEAVPASLNLKNLLHLKKLTVENIKGLTELPASLIELVLGNDREDTQKMPASLNLKNLPHLEKLTVENIKGLTELPASLIELIYREKSFYKQNITPLNLKDLSHLKKLTTLKYFISLNELPPSLEELNLTGEGNKSTSSNETLNLPLLKKLYLRNIRGLSGLPASLKELSLIWNDEDRNNEELSYLDGSDINFKNFQHMDKLTLTNIKGVRELPVSLKELILIGNLTKWLDVEHMGLENLFFLKNLFLDIILSDRDIHAIPHHIFAEECEKREALVMEKIISHLPENLLYMRIGHKILLQQIDTNIQDDISYPYKASNEDVRRFLYYVKVLIIYSNFYNNPDQPEVKKAQQNYNEISSKIKTINKNKRTYEEAFNFYNGNIDTLSLEKQLFPSEEENWLAHYPGD